MNQETYDLIYDRIKSHTLPKKTLQTLLESYEIMIEEISIYTEEYRLFNALIYGLRHELKQIELVESI